MVSGMKYIIPITLLLLSIFYFIYYVIIKYRYFKGDKLYGIVKDYKKYRRTRYYLLKTTSNEIIDYTSNRFYMLNTKILLSKYKDNYYTKDKLKDILFKSISLIVATTVLFVYILSY